jgi:pimeloyl-ACP methyl ester carboxylesterase
LEKKFGLRRYGKPPYTTAVIHGGPGAGGEMAPVARALSARFGVLEPIQTALSLDGQVAELEQLLREEASHPLTLIGFSWGAWLSWITTARFPGLVQKLILVSSGPFTEPYVSQLAETRQARLTKEERVEYAWVVEQLSMPGAQDKNQLLTRLGALAANTDSYAPLSDPEAELDRAGPRGDIFQAVWNAAAGMRRSGALVDLAGSIHCPVAAIHGAYDPHPAEGVAVPLAGRLADFHFHLLDQCGHTPWLESLAQEDFYSILLEEMD